ncbi:efflux RND transporter periplasmic adaptor subunit [Amycolatopsis sp.]|uniref:efflux RND transporter periplasmic adaptor subunit n=1 Tax=Amycolatopsis sp. TaxID=37632 RepID=UPI002E09A265|nr:biotin/lipoyl-binding protein [Amycolatopsis sp.]
MMRRRTWVINGVLIVLLCGAGFGIYQAFSPAESTAQAQTRSSPVTRGTVTETISAAGTVSSSYTGSADFSGSGKVTAINVAVGDVVTAGQKLATQDNTVATKQLQLAKANLAVADENLTTAEDAPTTTTGNNSAGTSGAQTTSITSLQAKVDQAQLDVDTAQTALADTVLTAPGAGTVTAINGAVGQSAGSGTSNPSSTSGAGQAAGSASSSTTTSSSSSSGFIVLTNMSDLLVNTSVAEIDVSKVKAGQKATVTINALPNAPVQATVSKVDLTPTTSGNVVSYGTQLALTSPPEGLRPGQSASVVITVAEADNVLSVPAAAVQTAGNTSAVVVEENGQNVTRPVQVGVRGESTVEITSGLTEGERVVLTAASPGATTGRTGTGTGGLGGTGGFPGTGTGGTGGQRTAGAGGGRG